MAVTNYTDLQTTLESYANRSDLSSMVPVFIQLCEADLKRRLKLVNLETSATVTLTSGVGTLPTDYVGMRSIYWDDDTDNALTYVTPDYFDALRELETGDPIYYTVTGSSLKVLPMETGSAVMTYQAVLASLSASNTTNAVITSYPDAYLQGSLKELYHYTRNWLAKKEASDAYEASIGGIILDHEAKKFPAGLEVRAR